MAAIIVGLPMVLLLVAAIGSATDLRVHDGQVVRNTDLVDRPVGGLTPAELAPVMDDLEDELRAAAVVVETPDGPLRATGEELGLVIDREATVADALDVGRRGSVVARPVSWARAIATPRTAPLRIELDPESVGRVVSQRDPGRRRPAVEPTIDFDEAGEAIVAVAGADGRGLDPPRVAAAIRAAVAEGDVPVVVEVQPGAVPPRFDLEDAERLAMRAQEVTADPVTVDAGGTQAVIPPETQRAWMRAEAEADLELAVDHEQVLEDLATLLPEAGAAATNAGFDLVGGRPVVRPSVDGTACCAPEAADLLLATVTDSADVAVVSLPLRPRPPARTTSDAQALGVVEAVASFTTNYPAGQPRVVNIHRIADLTRGVLIEPGERFSVNEFVGRRTIEKGFGPGGVISNGVFEEAIGGGISQFATTLFNAAFFAGLDIAEYQSHSIYISRYPFGREATLSYPKPDLVIANDTAYGVLLWPTYTRSSVTVTLYSTEHIDVVQSAQTSSPAGNCTRVRTERTRTWPADGRTEVDAVFATYRPAEGEVC